MSRVNPYTALQVKARKWARGVLHPQKILLWYWEKNALGTGDMRSLSERVHAANALGFDVRLSHDDKGNLAVHYVKRPNDVPWEIRP